MNVELLKLQIEQAKNELDYLSAAELENPLIFNPTAAAVVTNAEVSAEYFARLQECEQFQNRVTIHRE